MPLVPGTIKEPLKLFLKTQNAAKVSDPEAAMDAFCQKIEDLVFQAIKSQTITIPTGLVAVVGSPTAQANPAPIVITTPMIT